MIFKNSEDLGNNSYINKDFQALWEELLELIPKLTNKWDPKSANESDPLAVLLKLQAIFGDKINYNIDKSILERFPQTLTELRSAKNVYDTLGYNAPWYKAASTKLTFRYNVGINAPNNSINLDYDFYIPRFTMFCDEDQNIVFTLTDRNLLAYKFGDWTQSDKSTLYREALQGKINNYTINGVTKITADNLDANNRLYFTEPNIAQNGIFIDTKENFTTDNLWERVDNIYQVLSPYSYQFGVDPVSGACYIEFPDSIANTIQNGIYIKYITTDGLNGNVKARSINRYYDENVYAVDYTKTYSNIEIAGETNSEDLVEVDGSPLVINNIISVVNSLATSNGSNPAAIDEMYKNYKKVRNTFDTLVTLLDYENYIYRYEKPNGQSIVSNIRVSDRTNDLIDSARVWTLSKSQELYKIMVKLDDSEEAELDYNTVKFYPLNPIPDGGIETKEDFDYTFANDSFFDGSEANEATFGDETIIDPNSTSLINVVKNTKVMTTHIKEVPYNLITIPYDIKGNIYLNHKVSRYVAEEVKKNVDKALYKALNAREITLGEAPSYSKILEIIQGADDRIAYVALSPIEWVEDSISYQGDYEDIEEIALIKSILNGNTPWADFNNSFKFTASQNNININSFDSSDSSDNIIIRSKVELDSLGASYYRVEENENLVAYAPQYKTLTSYSNYLFYKSNFNYEKDSIYKLSSGEYIYLFETREDANAGSYKYKIEAGQIIKANIDITGSGKERYLTNTQQIDVISKIEGDLGKSTQEISWITNSRGLVDSFKSSSPTPYTLRSGEYFLFTTEGETAFTLLGEGNTMSASAQISFTGVDVDAWFNADWDALTQGYDQPKLVWQKNKGDAISYLQNQIMIFGEGYEFKYERDSSFSSWVGDGTDFELSTNDHILKYIYNPDKIDPSGLTEWNELTPILDEDSWKGFIRLSYSLNRSDNYKLNNISGSNYVGHSQKIIINDSSYEDIYLQSDIPIESIGGVNLIIPGDALKELNIKAYNLNEGAIQGIYFTRFPNDSSWTTPGDDSEDVVVFGFYGGSIEAGGYTIEEISSQDVTYVIAKGGTTLTLNGDNIHISQVKIGKQNSHYGLNHNNKLIDLIDSHNIAVIHDSERMINTYLEFNPTHDISENAYIKNPKEESSFFNKSHPCNKYALPKLNSLDGLQINEDSINT